MPKASEAGWTVGYHGEAEKAKKDEVGGDDIARRVIGGKHWQLVGAHVPQDGSGAKAQAGYKLPQS